MSRHTTIFLFCALGFVSCGPSPLVPTAEEKERAFMESIDLIELPDDVTNAITENAKYKHLVVSKKSERAENQLEVTTGGFHDGRGEIFRFRRDGEAWVLISQSIWVK